MTLLVVGNATVDVSFELESLPRPGETLLARGRMVDAGGKGLNQAVVARRAGAEVIYVAAIGDDPEADIIHARLAAEGLPGADLLCRPGPTDQSIIYLDRNGENMIVSTADRARSLTGAQVSERFERLGRGDLLLLQGNLARATTEDCLARGRASGMFTLLNPAPIDYPYAGLWPLVDLAVVNDVEAATLGGDGTPAESARRLLFAGAGAVVATLGPQGALIIEGARTTSVPAATVAVVDTAGAGDVFCGVLAAALSEGRALPDAVAWAVAAASLSVTRRGTSSAFPTPAELVAMGAQIQPREDWGRDRARP
jgi:ribokinase